MILYHGTDLKGNDGIISNGFIALTNAENRRYYNTTLGKIYLTTELVDAIKFSTQPRKGNTDYPVIIFEVEINESELSKDTDEKNWKSTVIPNGYENCYTVNRNLVLGIDVKRRFFNYCSNAADAGKFLQDVQFGRRIIREEEWENVPWADL